MIQLTRLNNTLLYVNPDLIKFVEKSPDTLLTLVSGEKVVVRETTEAVVQKILDFRCEILSQAIQQAGGVVPGVTVATQISQDKPVEG